MSGLAILLLTGGALAALQGWRSWWRRGGELGAWTLEGVVDGDTFRIRLSGRRLPHLLRSFAVRVAGVDTPEKGAPGAAEAHAELARLLRSRQVMLRRVRWGKYAGRVVAQVEANGRDVAEALVRGGYGVPYDGGRRG